MKTYARTLGVVVILSLVFLGSPAFCDEQAMGKAEMMYASVIDKEIGKDQAKIELQINNFLNEKFLEVSSSAWSLYCCAPRDNEKFLFAVSESAPF